MERSGMTRTGAESFISCLAARDFPAMTKLFAAGATYWVNGSQPAVPWSGEQTATDRMPQLEVMIGAFETYDVHLVSHVTEGNRAIAEFSVHGKMLNGLEYRNDVVMSFEMDADGQIRVLREYIDNMQALAFFASISQA